MLLQSLSETNWNTLIITVGTLLTTIVTGVVAILVAKLGKTATEAKEAAKQTAVKVEEVKMDLAETGEHTNKKLNEIHTLVNARMSQQLKISAKALRALARLTNDPDDIAAADFAEQSLIEHEQKQDSIDKNNKAI